MHVRMTLSNDTTFKLWQGFMPRRGEIENTREPLNKYMATLRESVALCH